MTSQFSRRGQSASSAAIFIAVLAGLLVLYILFLPPADRDALLFGGSDGFGGSGSGGYYGGSGSGQFVQYGSTLIMTETPGTLRLLSTPIQEHHVPSATIFTRVNTQEIQSIDSAIVKNGVFAKKNLEINFVVDKRTGRNYLLNFNVDQAGHAPIRVRLNDNLIYERPIRERTPAPIPLPFDYIVDGDNEITIETMDVGLAFWRPNTYILHNVLVSGDLIDTSGSVSEQTFSIQEEELAAFERAHLEFVPDCDPREAGRLTVHLNTRTYSEGNGTAFEVPYILYTGFVDCGIKFTTDIPRDVLRVGENRMLFASDSGQYIVDRIKVVVEMTESDYPIYYFNIPRDMFDTIDLGTRFLRLTMTFTDYRNVKSGEIVINGFVQAFSTQEYVYQAVVDPGILTPGPNTIQVIPHIDRLDIAEIKLELV